MIYIKLLNNHTEYSTLSDNSEFITPNVTVCKQEQIYYIRMLMEI